MPRTTTGTLLTYLLAYLRACLVKVSAHRRGHQDVDAHPPPHLDAAADAAPLRLGQRLDLFVEPSLEVNT